MPNSGVDCTDTYASTGILIHGAVGSTYLSGISARRCYGFLDDPGPAVRRERICQCHRGPQTPMLMNASAWQMSNMMLTAMIRDASETSCASSYYSRVRRPAASGKRERQQSLINFRFGAPAPRLVLTGRPPGAYKGVVPPGGAGRVCGPATTWGWPGASVRPVCRHWNTWVITTVARRIPLGSAVGRHPWQGTRPFPVCRR